MAWARRARRPRETLAEGREEVLLDRCPRGRGPGGIGHARQDTPSLRVEVNLAFGRGRGADPLAAVLGAVAVPAAVPGARIDGVGEAGAAPAGNPGRRERGGAACPMPTRPRPGRDRPRPPRYSKSAR